MKRIAAGLGVLVIVAAVSTGSAAGVPIPHPAGPPWPIVVPNVGAGCSAPDTGLHAYTKAGVVVTCNGSSWS